MRTNSGSSTEKEKTKFEQGQELKRKREDQSNLELLISTKKKMPEETVEKVLSLEKDQMKRRSMKVPVQRNDRELTNHNSPGSLLGRLL